MQLGSFATFKEWATYLGLIGIGAIVAALISLMTAVRVKRLEVDSARKEWLRNQRLEAFSVLGRAMLSFNNMASSGELKLIKNADEMTFLASESILLIDDEALRKKLYKFLDDYYDFITMAHDIAEYEKINKKSSPRRNDGQRLLSSLERSSRNIVADLAKYIHKD